MQQASHGGSAGHPHADHTGEHAGPGAPGPRAPGLRDVQRGVSNGWEVREWTVSSPSAVALSGPSEDPTGSGRGAGGRLQTSLGQWWLRSCRAHENRPGSRNTLPAAPGVQSRRTGRGPRTCTAGEVPGEAASAAVESPGFRTEVTVTEGRPRTQCALASNPALPLSSRRILGPVSHLTCLSPPLLSSVR